MKRTSYINRLLSTGLLILTACVGGISCSAEIENADSEMQTWNLEGELHLAVADLGDGAETKIYSLRTKAGDEYDLEFAVDPELAPFTRLRVQGSFVDAQRVAVDAFSVVAGTNEDQLPPDSDEVGTINQALIGSPARPTRRIALIILNNAVTRATADNEARKLEAYFNEVSYGIRPFRVDVFGSYSVNTSSCGSRYRQIATDARAVFRSQGHSESNYQHFAFVMPRNSGCGWGGLGQVGTPNNPAKDTWYHGVLDHVFWHEIGHNLGMGHASSLSCGGTAYRTNRSGCSTTEYGNVIDPMGNGKGHFQAYQKGYQLWFGGCNTVNATRNGRYIVQAIEPSCNGTQALRVPLDNQYLYVEYHRNRGVFFNVAPAYGNGGSQGAKPALLDMRPNTATFSDANLPVGQSYTFPNGVRFTVREQTASHAVVEVSGASGAAPVCQDGTAAPINSDGSIGSPSCSGTTGGGSTGGGSTGGGSTGGGSTGGGSTGGGSTGGGSTGGGSTGGGSTGVDTYLFRARHSGSCMRVQDSSKADGANIYQWTCNNTWVPNQWRIVPNGSFYQLVNVHSGMCARANGTANGTNVDQYTCNTHSNKDWAFENVGNGYYRIRNRFANQCLHVQNGGLNNGTNLYVWPCSSSTSDPNWYRQHWSLVQLTSSTPTTRLLSALNESKCMDVNGAGTTDGTNIQLYSCNNTAAQSFELRDLGNGTYNVVNPNSGKCVDVANSGTADGTNIQLYTCNNTAAQAFRMTDAGNGFRSLVNVASNKCVDVSFSNTADHTNIQLWSCNNTNAQRWRLAP